MGRTWVVALVAGCYHPRAATEIPCSPAGTCPAGQTCLAGICEPDGTELPIDAAIDAAQPVDASVDAQMIDAPPPPPRITFVSKTQSTVLMATPAASITVAHPTCPAGDVMIAAVAMGSTGSAAAPVFTPPTGWTLVKRLDRNNDTALAVYWHAAGAAEPMSYTWTLSTMIEGVAWISCYANVDAAAPIEAQMGLVIETTGPAYTTPAITTTIGYSMIVATFATHAAAATTWLPTGMTERVDVNNTTTRSGEGTEHLVPTAGSPAAYTSTASSAQDYALVHVLALKPAP